MAGTGSCCSGNFNPDYHVCSVLERLDRLACEGCELGLGFEFVVSQLSLACSRLEAWRRPGAVVGQRAGRSCGFGFGHVYCTGGRTWGSNYCMGTCSDAGISYAVSES